MDDERPVTRVELHTELAALEDRLVEKMRQIETNLLTAFHGYARGNTAHFHQLDITQHDVNLRLAALEDRVLALETRRPE